MPSKAPAEPEWWLAAWPIGLETDPKREPEYDPSSKAQPTPRERRAKLLVSCEPNQPPAQRAKALAALAALSYADANSAAMWAGRPASGARAGRRG